MRVVIFNGPSESGKTTASVRLANYLRNFTIYGQGHVRSPLVVTENFAGPIKHFMAVAMGEKYAELKKDEHLPLLAGQSIREVLIALSEEFMKPRFGEDIFGRLLYHRVLRYAPTPDYLIVDDGGFFTEAQPLGEYLPVLVHVRRQGKNFDNDSRSYWGNPNFILENNGTFDELYTKVKELSGILTGNDDDFDVKDHNGRIL